MPIGKRIRASVRALMLAAAATALPDVGPAAVSPAEQTAWDRARSSGSVDAFQRYLESYPTGQWAEEAFRIIIEQAWTSGLRTAPAAGLSTRIAPEERGQVISAAQSLY